MGGLGPLGPFAAYDSLSQFALLLGLSTTRVAVAFLLVPLFTSELIPALIRNALFLALAVLSLALQPVPNLGTLSSWQWIAMFGKEAFVGGVIGIFFASTMWAFEAAGQIIDTKAGTSIAQVLDPLSGHQTSLSGAFLARVASWVFMAGGGFMLMVGVLIESYAQWPLSQMMPSLAPAGSALFEAEFGRVMRLSLLIAAPALVLLYVVDGVLGLVNRFAQQLNVFSLSGSLKAFLANWILLVQLSTLVVLLADDLLARPAVVLDTLRRLVVP